MFVFIVEIIFYDFFKKFLVENNFLYFKIILIY